MRTVLSDPDRTDDFRAARAELYLAATDLDTCERIVFGADGWDDVPISTRGARLDGAADGLQARPGRATASWSTAASSRRRTSTSRSRRARSSSSSSTRSSRTSTTSRRRIPRSFGTRAAPRQRHGLPADRLPGVQAAGLPAPARDGAPVGAALPRRRHRADRARARRRADVPDVDHGLHLARGDRAPRLPVGDAEARRGLRQLQARSAAATASRSPPRACARSSSTSPREKEKTRAWRKILEQTTGDAAAPVGVGVRRLDRGAAPRPEYEPAHASASAQPRSLERAHAAVRRRALVDRRADVRASPSGPPARTTHRMRPCAPRARAPSMPVGAAARRRSPGWGRPRARARAATSSRRARSAATRHARARPTRARVPQRLERAGLRELVRRRARPELARAATRSRRRRARSRSAGRRGPRPSRRCGRRAAAGGPRAARSVASSGSASTKSRERLVEQDDDALGQRVEQRAQLGGRQAARRSGRSGCRARRRACGRDRARGRRRRRSPGTGTAYAARAARHQRVEADRTATA